MLKVLITIDTEYSAGLHVRDPAAGPTPNFARSIACETPTGAVGVGYQMDRLDAFGLTGVFFVDPAPGWLWGQGAVDRIVQPIVERGHDVQLHLHTEWLAFTSKGPLAGRVGRNLREFTQDEQVELLDRATEMLVRAGAARPVAFRAGNYGANDDTLRALAAVGIRCDTSFSPALIGGDCQIDLPADAKQPTQRHGVIEVPIGSIGTAGGGQRHGQLTALSTAELTAALAYEADAGAPHFTLVSHSFELLSRDRTRANRLVQRRFDRLCEWIAGSGSVTTATYRDDPPIVATVSSPPPLPPSRRRTLRRQAEQAVGNALYGRS